MVSNWFDHFSYWLKMWLRSLLVLVLAFMLNNGLKVSVHNYSNSCFFHFRDQSPTNYINLLQEWIIRLTKVWGWKLNTTFSCKVFSVWNLARIVISFPLSLPALLYIYFFSSGRLNCIQFVRLKFITRKLTWE